MGLPYFIISLMFFGPGPAPLGTQGSVEKLGQHLVGSWISQEGKVEEHWTSATGGLMLGLNRDASRAGTPFFEFMRIEQRGEDVFYVAQPKGAPGTAFKLVLLDEKQAVFENEHHDFPQVITYRWQEKNKLCASIGTFQEREKISWCWQRGSLIPAQQPAK